MTPRVDQEGNLVYSQVGRVWTSGDQALLQNITTHLLLQEGEYPYDSTQGVDFNNLLWRNNRDLVITTLESEIKEDPRVSYVTTTRKPAPAHVLHLHISIKAV